MGWDAERGENHHYLELEVFLNRYDDET